MNMGRCRRGTLSVRTTVGLGWFLLGCVVVGTATAETTHPLLYRIFLQQGGPLVSYGDYVRVDDRVIFSLLLSADLRQGRTQLVSVSAAVVDWATTERYSDAARGERYATRRGEAAFNAMSADVARVLNEIAFTGNPERQLRVARETRQRLVTWTEANYGYRADDIAEVVALLDEAIAGLGAVGGEGAFSVSLVATTARPSRMPLLPEPSLQEIIAQALTVAQLTPVPAERLSVLQAVVGLLDDPASNLPPGWSQTTRALADRELQDELRIEQDYTDLARTVLTRASAYAGQADVRGVQSVLDEMLVRDEVLGRRRVDYMSAVISAVEARLSDAQELRLARDGWQLRIDSFRQYQTEVSGALTQFGQTRTMLDDIRLLAGPDAGSLMNLVDRLTQTVSALDRTVSPGEVRPVHDLFRQAFVLAARAASERYRAVLGGDLPTAWTAASAAAGSMLLFDRATQELGRTLRLPEPN